MIHHRESYGEDLWGFVERGDTTWYDLRFQEELAKDDKHWTKSCTHPQPAKGFTCGLWNLFHILTIKSSKLEHKLYGFHCGYFVSPHHVSETIRNFVAYQLSGELTCASCWMLHSWHHRLQFCSFATKTMCDSCGHQHCSCLQS
ncbi:hypothetical protein ACHAWF_005487 [Thalassiosira exigua]